MQACKNILCVCSIKTLLIEQHTVFPINCGEIRANNRQLNLSMNMKAGIFVHYSSSMLLNETSRME